MVLWLHRVQLPGCPGGHIRRACEQLGAWDVLNAVACPVHCTTFAPVAQTRWRTTSGEHGARALSFPRVPGAAEFQTNPTLGAVKDRPRSPLPTLLPRSRLHGTPAPAALSSLLGV
jgi:hypothetical protein